MSTMPTPRVPLAERLWRRVDKTETCWFWTGAKAGGGYGVIVEDAPSRKMRGVHRVAYELTRGPIPDGLVVNHLCRTPACVRPDHLEAVTQAENVAYSDRVLGIRSVLTHCPQGHEYTPENTRLRLGKWRHCRACDLARTRQTGTSLNASQRLRRQRAREAL